MVKIYNTKRGLTVVILEIDIRRLLTSKLKNEKIYSN